MKIVITGAVILLLLGMSLGLAYVYEFISYDQFKEIGGKTAMGVSILIFGGLLANFLLKAAGRNRSQKGESQKNQGPKF
jgi:uncharacterized membrane protein